MNKDSEKTKQYILRIPESFHRDLKSTAPLLGTTMQEIILTGAVKEFKQRKKSLSEGRKNK